MTDPDLFDYIDLNPSSPLLIERALELHWRTRKPMVVTSANAYAFEEDRASYLALTGNAMLHPQWILSEEELRQTFSFLSAAEWRKVVGWTHEAASRIGQEARVLRKAPIITADGDLEAELAAGREHRLRSGHIEAWTDAYEARLRHELAMIDEKGFRGYFLVVGDMVRWAKQRMLVGPARGSSAGSLVCYLLRITEVDPLVHDLLFERFIDINRSDLPDIDVDFSDRSRDLVFEYLKEKYGEANVARLGNISRLKPRSVLAECGKRLGVPIGDTFEVRNVLIEHSSGDSRYGQGLEDTLEQTEPGRKFARKHPYMKCSLATENHAWHTSVHAAGVLVSNEPVTRYCTVVDGVAQLDKPDAEALNLLKIDALGLRTLGVIEETGKVTPDFLYTLKLDDDGAFDVLNSGKFAGIFQFEGRAQRRVAREVFLDDFRRVDQVTALARPGPLGSGALQNYVPRARGDAPTEYIHPALAEFLDDTCGVVLYQEQVMRIVREIGGFSWEDTSFIRKAMSGRKGDEYFARKRLDFIAGATRLHGVAEDAAAAIWDQIATMGSWAMNKSHTTSYAVISYWCAYMKAHHHLDYAAALLRNAKDDDQAVEMLRELHEEGVVYTPFDPELSALDWSVANGRLIGGFLNLPGVGHAKGSAMLERRAAGTLTEKDLATMAKPPKFGSIYPTRELWRAWYEDPGAHGVRVALKEFGSMDARDRCCVIARVVGKERRDMNEAVQRHRRGGSYYRGQPLYLDLKVLDDSTPKPVKARISARDWLKFGEHFADTLRDGVDWVLIYGDWAAQYQMMHVIKMKVITPNETS